jgi:CheY-like chemotaxis protein
VYELDGLHVLVVDDDADGRELLAEVLRKHRARVTAASCMREALAALVAHKPHVLVSDIAMEGADGYELIRRVRDRAPHEGGAVPALALTAYARHEDRARALRAGFQMHAAKPIEPLALVAAVASLAGQRGDPKRSEAS